ncbi:MAG: cupredoxin domain-containing protein, partial [bacterium]
MKLVRILYACSVFVGVAGLAALACDTFVLAPPTLLVVLSADPPSGDAPLQGVDLTVQVSGTATGPITYRFDCTNDGTSDVNTTEDGNTYTAVDVCSYDEAGTYTAKVVAERDGVTAEATATITVESAPPSSSTNDTVTVSMKDNFFSPREVTVKPGATIIWPNDGSRPHTSTSDDDIWDSGTVDPGGSFSWTVPATAQSGTSLPYFCVFHGARGGVGMAGVIRVDDGAPPPPATDTVRVSMKDAFFSPRDAHVGPGTTILWKNFGLIAHTSTSDDNIWDSGTVQQGESYAWTVPTETPLGTTFPYFCIFHGDPGGVGMAGTIRVGSGEKTLSVALGADPASGEAPLQGVDLVAQ